MLLKRFYTAKADDKSLYAQKTQEILPGRGYNYYWQISAFLLGFPPLYFKVITGGCQPFPKKTYVL